MPTAADVAPTLTNVQMAAQDVGVAAEHLDDQKARRDRLAIAAVATGFPVTAVAVAAGVSRQHLHRLLAEQ